MNPVFLGLGGNIGDPVQTIHQCCKKIQNIHCVHNLEVSKLYRTTPVSDIPQANYINAVALIHTTLSPRELYKELVQIEVELGKVEKEKDKPRAIDIDILFYGDEYYEDQDLVIPHSRWRNRLFVVKPLNDLVSKISIPKGNSKIEKEVIDLEDYLLNFPNIYNETVLPIN